MQFSSMDELLSMSMDAPSKKRRMEYGLKVAQGIFNSADRNTDGYYGKRYRQWRANRDFSYGTNSMKEFMDLMRIEGNQSYINLDWTPIKIAPKFVEILLFFEGASIDILRSSSILENCILFRLLRQI